MRLKFEHDVSLAARTTLGVGGPAARLAKVTTRDELVDALGSAAGEPVLVLGGGSNLVVRDGGWPGLVVQMAIPGVGIADDGDHAIATVGAGVVWDDLVAQLVGEKLVGVECLGGIPGLAGATPMQNVGAYGQEVADTIRHVTVLDRETGRFETLAPDACGFGYRTSVFKGSERWIVVEVQLRLARGAHSAPIKYAELAKALGVTDGGTAPLATVRETVIALRRGKGMVLDAADPESRSAGSFFTNPIVDASVADALTATYPGMPRFAAEAGKVKLAAGWLIERAGFSKGYSPSTGAAGISKKHALALVNRGGATAAELLDLAAEIQAGVRDKLGVELSPEPVIVGV